MNQNSSLNESDATYASELESQTDLLTPTRSFSRFLQSPPSLGLFPSQLSLHEMANSP